MPLYFYLENANLLRKYILPVYAFQVNLDFKYLTRGRRERELEGQVTIHNTWSLTEWKEINDRCHRRSGGYFRPGFGWLSVSLRSLDSQRQSGGCPFSVRENASFTARVLDKVYRLSSLGRTKIQLSLSYFKDGNVAVPPSLPKPTKLLAGINHAYRVVPGWTRRRALKTPQARGIITRT